MTRLEKILIAATALLLIAAVVILMLPDASGNSGLKALSPYLKSIGESGAAIINRFNASLGSMSNGRRTPVLQGVSPSSGGKSQPNPIDSAVGPAAGYGQTQKNMFEKPLEGLQP